MNTNTRLRWLFAAGALLLTAAAAGFAYNFGLTEGLARAGGDPAAALAHGHRHWGHWGFPFFPVFLLFFFWFAVARTLWWGGGYRHGYGWPRGMPPEAFEEWHRQAHARETREKGPAGADDSDRRGRHADRDDRV